MDPNGPRETKKTMRSPRSGAISTTGGTKGNSGGKKGRSGPKPMKWGDFLAELREKDATFRATIRRAAYDEESRGFPHVLRMIAMYDPDAPGKKIDVNVNVRGVVALPVMQVPMPGAGATIIDVDADVTPDLAPPTKLKALNGSREDLLNMIRGTR